MDTNKYLNHHLLVSIGKMKHPATRSGIEEKVESHDEKEGKPLGSFKDFGICLSQNLGRIDAELAEYQRCLKQIERAKKAKKKLKNSEKEPVDRVEEIAGKLCNHCKCKIPGYEGYLTLRERKDAQSFTKIIKYSLNSGPYLIATFTLKQEVKTAEDSDIMARMPKKYRSKNDVLAEIEENYHISIPGLDKKEKVFDGDQKYAAIGYAVRFFPEALREAKNQTI